MKFLDILLTNWYQLMIHISDENNCRFPHLPVLLWKNRTKRLSFHSYKVLMKSSLLRSLLFSCTVSAKTPVSFSTHTWDKGLLIIELQHFFWSYYKNNNHTGKNVFDINLMTNRKKDRIWNATCVWVWANLQIILIVTYVER